MATLLCYIATLLFAVDAQLFPSVLTEITSDRISQGALLTSMYLFFPATSSFGGLLADRFGKPAILAFGMALMALPFIFGGSFESTQARVLLALSFGIGGGIVEGQSSAFLSDLHPRRRLSVLNIAQVFYCAGAAGGPFVVTILYRLLPRPDVSPILAGFGFFSLTLIPFFLLLARRSASHKQHEKVDLQALFADRIFGPLCLSIFLYVAVEFGVAGWIVTYGVNHLGMNMTHAPLLLTVFWIGLGISRGLVGFGLVKLNPERILSVSFYIIFIFQILCFVSGNSMLVFISVTCLGFGMGAVWPTIVSIAGKHFSNSSGTAIGIVVAAGALAIPVVTPIITALSGIRFLNLRGVFLLLPVLTIANAILVRKKITPYAEQPDYPR